MSGVLPAIRMRRRYLSYPLRENEQMKKSSETDLVRCHWAQNEVNIPYHDEDWGVPVHDERKWFEFLILEGAQAGVSWDTILRKRARYREVVDGFDPEKVGRYDRKKVRELLRDAGIIRNKLKIDAAIGSARAFLKVQEEFGSFDRYVWRFVDGRPRQNAWKRSEEHTSELQSRLHLVCRLLLEKKTTVPIRTICCVTNLAVISSPESSR